MNIISLVILIIMLTGCAGLGLNKRATVVPDEVWITGDTNYEEEDSSKIGFGLKWKLK